MRRYLVPIALFFVALPAAADAPPDQYDSFTKDDATIHDLHTGLVWDRQLDSHHQLITPVGAYATIESYCIAVPNRRVPTIKELMTLFDEAPHEALDGTFGKTTVFVDQGAFPAMRFDKPYWSSTPADLIGPNMVWTLNFNTGAMTALDKGGSGAVRCVE